MNYKVTSGYALVINNYLFPRRDDVERDGSNDDVKNLVSLFDDFNFRHVVKDNQTGSEMLKILKDTADKDFTRYECFVCVILSHGTKDGIYGTDDEMIKLEATRHSFVATSAPRWKENQKYFSSKLVVALNEI